MKIRKTYLIPVTEVISLKCDTILAEGSQYFNVDPEKPEMEEDDDAG